MAVLKIVIAMIIWGSIGVFVKWIDLPSTELVFLRAAIASVFLFGVRYFLKKKRADREEKISYDKKNLIMLIVAGIIMAINWLFLFQAYKYTTVANSTLSYYMAPVVLIFLSPLVLKEKLNYKSVIGIFLAMIGLILIVIGNPSESGGNYEHGIGIVYGLMAAVLYATVVLMNKRIKGFTSFDRTLIQISVSALVLLPLVMMRGQLSIESLNMLIIILILGCVHTGVAYLLYFSSFEGIEGQRLAILSYVDPVSAVVFGTVFLSEPLSIYHIVGGGLILVSAMLPYLGKRRV